MVGNALIDRVSVLNYLQSALFRQNTFYLYDYLETTPTSGIKALATRIAQRHSNQKL